MAEPPEHRGEFEVGRADAEPLRLLVVGDSIAAGYAIPRFDETLAGRVAQHLGRARRVRCSVRAVSGSVAADLSMQVGTAATDIALVVTGANDIWAGVQLDELVRQLRHALSLLETAQLVVLVGPGDVSTLPAVPEGVRSDLRVQVHAFAEAMRAVAAEFPNVVHVGPPKGIRLGREHFGTDGYHPSALGHELIFRLVEAVLPF